MGPQLLILEEYAVFFLDSDKGMQCTDEDVKQDIKGITSDFRDDIKQYFRMWYLSIKGLFEIRGLVLAGMRARSPMERVPKALLESVPSTILTPKASLLEPHFHMSREFSIFPYDGSFVQRAFLVNPSFLLYIMKIPVF